MHAIIDRNNNDIWHVGHVAILSFLNLMTSNNPASTMGLQIQSRFLLSFVRLINPNWNFGSVSNRRLRIFDLNVDTTLRTSIGQC